MNSEELEREDLMATIKDVAQAARSRLPRFPEF